MINPAVESGTTKKIKCVCVCYCFECFEWSAIMFVLNGILSCKWKNVEYKEAVSSEWKESSSVSFLSKELFFRVPKLIGKASCRSCRL